LRLIYENDRKSDQVDAEYLARLARVDPELLAPIEHRGPEAQKDLAVLRARDALVRSRTTLINVIRGSVKSTGARLPSCDAHSFHRKVTEVIPEALRPALVPLLEVLEELTAKISCYDKQIEALCETKYPETQRLRQPKGVGPLTALAFLLIIEDPRRFKKSRNVGPYLGLVPRRQESGAQQPQLRITKAGDKLLRRLLVSSAHYVLGPFGEDSDLRRHGEAIARRGGKNAKKRAVVAVARKLSVLLHRLWVSGEDYEPLRNAQKKRGSGGKGKVVISSK
jgi:transposase